jgi:hypothetical protein
VTGRPVRCCVEADIVAGNDYFVASLLAELLGEGELQDCLARGNVGTRLASHRVVDVLVERGVLQHRAGSVVLVRADEAIPNIDRAVAERERARRAP